MLGRRYTRQTIDAGKVSGHNRRLTYWTNWRAKITGDSQLLTTYLEPLEDIPAAHIYDPYEFGEELKEAYAKGAFSATDSEKARGVTASWRRGLPYNLLVDRRCRGKTVARRFSALELERLCGFPDGWVSQTGERYGDQVGILGASLDVNVLLHLIVDALEWN